MSKLWVLVLLCGLSNSPVTRADGASTAEGDQNKAKFQSIADLIRSRSPGTKIKDASSRAESKGIVRDASDFQKQVDTGLDKSNPCPPGAQESPTQKTAHLPLFEEVEQSLQTMCRAAVLSESACKQFVKDYFEIGSPTCPSGDIKEVTAGCTQGMGYIVSELTGPKQEYYTHIIQRITQIVNKHQKEHDPSKQPDSVYDVFLEAARGDRPAAILLLSATQLGTAGISSISTMIDMAPSATPQLRSALREWKPWKGGPLRDVYPKICTVPKQDQPHVPEVSAYPHWSNALLASGLRQRGYPESLARFSASASTVVYEYYFKILQRNSRRKLAENHGQPQPLTDRLRDGNKVITFSDLGSQLGASVSDFEEQLEKHTPHFINTQFED